MQPAPRDDGGQPARPCTAASAVPCVMRVLASRSAQLPMRMGGLGFGSAVQQRHAAYWAPPRHIGCSRPSIARCRRARMPPVHTRSAAQRQNAVRQTGPGGRPRQARMAALCALAGDALCKSRPCVSSAACCHRAARLRAARSLRSPLTPQTRVISRAAC